jgi:outer membrane protein
MNNNRFTVRSLLITISFLTFVTPIAISQQATLLNGKSGTDSLTLKEIISLIVTTHPTVKSAAEAINNADARIGLAKTGYNPEADVLASYSNIGPVTELSIPNMGTFQLFPANNYSAQVNIRQTIYDFGRTRENINFENENKLLSEQTLEQAKQKMSMMAISNYFTLLFLQYAIRIKDEQLSALNEHLDYVKKKMATGSATEYEVLTTQVRISEIESQKVELGASVSTQQAFLNSLIGNDQSANPVVKNDLTTELPIIPSDSLQSYAYKNRDEVLINQKRASLAELKYNMTQLVNKPMISFVASGGAKNGYVPELEKVKANYVVGLGLRIPIYDGSKSKYNGLQAKSVINSVSYESENTKRTISDELREAEAYMEASSKKLSQYELQLKQALKAYSLAQTSFKSGSITNLDLLDANTSVSQSRLLLLKAKIDYAASIYKLKAAIGERLY